MKLSKLLPEYSHHEPDRFICQMLTNAMLEIDRFEERETNLKRELEYCIRLHDLIVPRLEVSNGMISMKWILEDDDNYNFLREVINKCKTSRSS